MAAIIRIKRSTGTSAPGSLKTGELAYSAGTGTSANNGDRMFYGKGDDGSGNATSVVVIGGEYFADLLDHTPGTLTASSAIVVDANSKVDQLLSGDIVITGSSNTITGLADPSVSSGAATKNYVDTQVTTVSTLTLAGDAASSGDVSLADSDLSIVGGEGIDVTASGNGFTVAGEDASTTNKGIASFDANDFSVSSGAVSIKAAGVGNSQLENSSVTVGTTSIALGSSSTTLAGLTQIDVDNIRILDNTIASTTGVLYIDPNPIDSDGGDLIIRGNLTVQGTTTTVNSTTVSVNDKNMVLADSAANAAAADGAGLTIGGAGYSGTQATLTFNGANDEWEFNKTLNLPSGTSLEFAGVDWKETLEDHFANNYFLAGEGIDLTYVDGSNTFTIAAELATTSNPGVASFDTNQFTVTTGAVSIYDVDGGTY